jgi:hypothetical protein
MALLREAVSVWYVERLEENIRRSLLKEGSKYSLERRKGLLKLQTQVLENKEEKQSKPPKLSAITFVHLLCLSLFSPFFSDVFTPQKKREWKKFGFGLFSFS